MRGTASSDCVTPIKAPKSTAGMAQTYEKEKPIDRTSKCQGAFGLKGDLNALTKEIAYEAMKMSSAVATGRKDVARSAASAQAVIS